MPARTPLQYEVLHALERVLGPAATPIPLHEPYFSGHEWEYVKDCLDSGWVSSAGRHVDEFEQQLAEYTGADHAIAVVNGTAALHIALRLAGVEPGDEVFVPALSFVATANAVTYCGATPHFLDSDPRRFGICPQAFASHLETIAERCATGWRNRESGRRLAAVVPMHVFGMPVDMAPLLELCARYGLPVIEDAAEALGSLYGNRHAGTLGQSGVLSFNGNKIITTGGGGALLTDDPEIARHARHLTTTAKTPHPWAFFHDETGYNYRLPNLNAALGCAQMARLPEFLAAKRRLAEAYAHAFSKCAEVRFVEPAADSTCNHWLNTLCLTNPERSARDALLDTLLAANYHCRPVWTLLSRLPMYAGAPRAPLPIASILEDSLINLPSSAMLQPCP